ncbi:MAG: RluA family pseudouridine synthase [Candidatus Woesearchaeota archaeon]|jgi:23S rRNA pseudouridine1911/1915/1917 synthase|nr:RluA family pseudouridine synthase [Candidatus Woesearchaeota archaeon]
MSIEINITKEFDGVKPKNFIKKNIDIPFFKVVNLIKDKRITINGKKIKQDDILREGDVLKVWPNDITLREKKKYQENMEDLGIEVVFENDNFIIFNKIAGVVVQGAQHDDKSFSLHLAWYKNKIGDESSYEYFHAHRLDKDTSGLLAVAKNEIAIRNLNEIFRQRDVVKKYVCLCVGEFEEKEGKVEVLMTRNPQGSHEKMRIVEKFEKETKKSLSLYKVLEEYEDKDGDIFSLVEVEIKTGITHQIRVHMKSLGHAILGDKMYGNSFLNRKYEDRLSRQFLHAKYLKFNYEGEEFEVEAPITLDLENFLKNLKKF